MQAEIKLFSEGKTAAEQADALSGLIKLKQLHQAAKDERFAQGVAALSAAAKGAKHPDERFAATAALLRIGNLVKAWQSRIAESLAGSLCDPLPPLESVPDPNDRYYIATFWRFTTPEWAQSYLATAAGEEEGSEKVRLECLEGLIGLASSLSVVVKELTAPIRRISFQTEKPGDSKGRRLRRLLDATCTAFAATSKDLGESVGDDIGTLLTDTFKNSGPPISESVVRELAEQVLALLHEIVKARFSVATSPRTYAAIDVVRGWFREDEWEEFAEASPSGRLVARDIAEAMEILIRAGIGDDELFTRLSWATGNAERARESAKAILARNPGLSEELSHWLSGKPIRRRSTLAAQSQMLAFEEALAQILIDGERLLELGEQVRRDVLPELSVIAPHSAAALENLLGFVRTTFGSVQSVAGSRLMRVRGEAGSVVEFSPLEHEIAGGPLPGVRKVRIVRPAVEAPGEGGALRIVRKALVEPAL
jgi:hypothetical protein